MKNKLHELIKFPCNFTYKVIGMAHPELVDKIIRVIQLQIPGDYAPVVKKSNRGNYLSISITIFASNINQIEHLYYELSRINIVRIVL
ncbi:UPF0250 protein YbeD [Buchnera aphidicola (Neophyllaphis podocarpi)]|uniref:DUF493 family protein YbeD n=1 Tax=Buchnera aphidicola TaxID=9 RepID=UPI0031B81818